MIVHGVFIWTTAGRPNKYPQLLMAVTENPNFLILGLIFGAYFDKRQKEADSEA